MRNFFRLPRLIKALSPYLHPNFMKSPPVTEENDIKQSKLPLILSIAGIGALIAAYFIFPEYQQFMDEAFAVLTSGDKARITGWVSQFGFWGPFIIILAMVAQMFLLVIPTVLLMVISVVAFGPVWGSAFTLAGIVTASSIGYAIGAYLGAAAVSKMIGSKTEQKIEEYVHKYGSGAVIITRISPFLSNDAISFVCGLVRMGYWKFMKATLIGILPLVLLIAFLGESNDRMIKGLIWVSAVSLAGFVAYILYDRSRKRKTQANKPEKA